MYKCHYEYTHSPLILTRVTILYEDAKMNLKAAQIYVGHPQTESHIT